MVPKYLVESPLPLPWGLPHDAQLRLQPWVCPTYPSVLLPYTGLDMRAALHGQGGEGQGFEGAALRVVKARAGVHEGEHDGGRGAPHS